MYFSHGNSNSTGVLIAFREGLNYRTESTSCDLEGHFLTLKAVVQDIPVILINYYALNDESLQVLVLLEINRIVTGLDLEQNTSIIGGEGVYFLNLGKRNEAKSHLRRTFISENVETRSQDQIMSSLKSFCSTLYKRQSEKSEAECLDFLGNLNIPKLSDDDRTSC